MPRDTVCDQMNGSFFAVFEINCILRVMARQTGQEGTRQLGLHMYIYHAIHFKIYFV